MRQMMSSEIGSDLQGDEREAFRGPLHLETEPNAVAAVNPSDTDPIAQDADLSSPMAQYLRTRKKERRDDWIQPLYLGVGLFLVLFPFWLLDSLKDPLLSTLTLNLERHQPPAKLVSVGTTLALVCLLEYIAHERREQLKKKQQGKDRESLIFRQAESSAEDVLDGGGTWTRMNFGDSSESEGDTGVPSTIFASIGIPYCITFGVMAYLLQFHALAKPRTALLESGLTYWHLLGYMIYAAIESYGSLAVAAFWSYTNSTLSLEQAEAFYGPIIAIAQLGAIAGSTMVTINVYDHVTLVVVACLVMILHIVVMHLYMQRYTPSQPRPVLPPEREEPLHLQKLTWRGREKSSRRLPWLTGIYLILEHNYVLLILGASCLYDISLTCLNYQMTLLGWDRHGASDLDPAGMSFTRFMGRYGQLVNVSSLILSSVVFPFLIRKLGLRQTLRLFPTLLLIVNLIAFIALPGNLSVLFLSLSLLKAMTYSIHDPSTEILYLPTAPQIKFQAKFWIDIVGARIAKALGSSINKFAGNVNRSIRVASAPSLCTALALWWVCYKVGDQFDSLIKNQETVGGGNSTNINKDDEDYERESLLNDDETEAEIVFECSSSISSESSRFVGHASRCERM